MLPGFIFLRNQKREQTSFLLVEDYACNFDNQ
jgi:hypothetical protein